MNYEQNLRVRPDGAGFMETQQKYLQDSFMKVRNTIKDPELQAKADIIFEQTKGRHQLTGMKDVEKKQTSMSCPPPGTASSPPSRQARSGPGEQYTDYFDNVVKPRIDSVIDDPLERKKAYALFGQQMAGSISGSIRARRLPKSQVAEGNQLSSPTSRGVFQGQHRRRQSRSCRGSARCRTHSGNRSRLFRGTGTRPPMPAGGANKSQHLSGNAIDLDVSNLSREQRVAIIETASNAGITGIGVAPIRCISILGPQGVGSEPSCQQCSAVGSGATVQRHMAGKARSMEGGAGGLWNRLIATESGGNQSAVSPKGQLAVRRSCRQPGRKRHGWLVCRGTNNGCAPILSTMKRWARRT